jgi:hypothetical protein
MTNANIDHLPKNLFICDMQSIPTVEIDRGAIYKDTFKSLEDLKAKLQDFSGKTCFSRSKVRHANQKINALRFEEKLQQSEERLICLCESKKREVSIYVDKLIEKFRQMEDDLNSEIDDFKNNRLT